jgi:hypothetical protein
VAAYANIDCSLPFDPKIAKVGIQGEALYVRSILWCRANLTDGVIYLSSIPHLTVGMRRWQSTITALVGVELWSTHPDGYCIPVYKWTRWNPLAVEVKAKRQGEAARKQAYRDRVSGSRPNGTGASRPTGTDSGTGWTRDGQRETETETETETSSYSSFSFNSRTSEVAEEEEQDLDEIDNEVIRIRRALNELKREWA